MTVKYTKDHEWIDTTSGKTGITDYARDALGDLVFLDLPKAGRILKRKEYYAVVESVKAASEIYAPVAGEIVAVNDNLANSLDDLKEDLDKGWIVQLKIADAGDLNDLMDKAAYDAYLRTLG
ncbi:MAG: glycine cleavage system protein GcvH [Alphaproteobacteria bacterium]|nr:glycine cleavage system protein GcvH [Alphaproteobacteria bacterium]